MAQEVFRRLLTSVAHVQYQADPVISVVDKVALRNVFLRVLRLFSACINTPMFHAHLHLRVAATRRTNVSGLGTFQNALPYRISGSTG
jgi:hypothetical protein